MLAIVIVYLDHFGEVCVCREVWGHNVRELLEHFKVLIWGLPDRIKLVIIQKEMYAFTGPVPFTPSLIEAYPVTFCIVCGLYLWYVILSHAIKYALL